jgi:hypothetical protein
VMTRMRGGRRRLVTSLCNPANVVHHAEHAWWWGKWQKKAKRGERGPGQESSDPIERALEQAKKKRYKPPDDNRKKQLGDTVVQLMESAYKVRDWGPASSTGIFYGCL